MSYDIKTPELINDKWLVFKNSIFNELDTLDCDDTIEGKCYEDKTFDQCMDICDKSDLCAFGYYISRKNNSNLCVPIKTPSDSLNISYRLRNQNIYPELDHAVVKTFLDKNVYQFPPADANTIFYMDNFLFENVETNTIVNNTILSDVSKKTISKVIDTNDVVFSNDGELLIHMLEIPISLAVGLEYVPVKYGDKVAFNIPTTNLVMRPSLSKNTLEWISRSFNLSPSSSFTLIPLPDSKKKIGDYVSYSDTFSIQSSNVFILGVNEWYNIQLYYYKNYKEAKVRNKNVTFRFKPKEQGWYCNNKKSEIVSFDKMIVDENGIGTYNGMKISRYPNSFGMCKDEPVKPVKPVKPVRSILLLILLIIFIIFFTVYILCKNCNKN
jgi:hypothetical protein